MTARTWFFVSVLALVVALGWAALVLPERVPVHFGLTGRADRFTDRPTALLELALVGLGLVALFVGAASLVRRAPLSRVSVPHKDYWSAPAREPVLRRRMADDVWVLGALTVGLVAAVSVGIVLVADDREPSLGGWGWALVAAFLLAVFAYTSYVLLVRYRPEGR